MGVLLNIQVALNTKLNALSPAVNTAWPNTDHKPVENTSYIRPTLLPASGISETLAGGMYHKGIYQIDIYVPAEKGTAALLAIADNIYTLFKSAVLTESGTNIHIEAINLGPSDREDAWYRGIIEIHFRAFDA